MELAHVVQDGDRTVQVEVTADAMPNRTIPPVCRIARRQPLPLRGQVDFDAVLATQMRHHIFQAAARGPAACAREGHRPLQTGLPAKQRLLFLGKSRSASS